MYTKEQALGMIASYTPSHTAQAELLSLSTLELRRSLAYNPHLSPRVWDVIYQELTSLDMSSVAHNSSAIGTMLNNAPTKEQKLLVLTYPDLHTVLTALEQGYTDPELIQKIIELPTFTTQHAAALLASGTLPEPFIKPLWNLLSTDEHAIEWTERTTSNYHPHTELHAAALQAMVAEYKLLTDEEVFNFIERYTPFPQMRLDQILDYRPTLIENLLEAKWHIHYLDSISASRYLTDAHAERILLILQKLVDKNSAYGQLRCATLLLYNPGIRASLRLQLWPLVKKVYKPTHSASIRNQIRKLKREATLAKPPLATPWGTPFTGKAKSAAQTLGTWRYPTLNPYQHLLAELDPSAVITQQLVEEQITPALDAAGPKAWQIFLALLPNWDQGLDELLSLVRTTAVE